MANPEARRAEGVCGWDCEWALASAWAVCLDGDQSGGGWWGGGTSLLRAASESVVEYMFLS